MLKRQTKSTYGSSSSLLGEKKFYRYKDVCSLYPACQYYGSYPIGTPIVRRGDYTPEECSNFNIKGLVMLKILPPKDLLRPVLGQRAGQHLCFALCTTCAETKQKEACNHSDEERAISGT